MYKTTFFENKGLHILTTDLIFVKSYFRKLFCVLGRIMTSFLMLSMEVQYPNTKLKVWSCFFIRLLTCFLFFSTSDQRCLRVERTRLVSRPTWRNTSFNASHLVRPAQLHHRYCLSGDWPCSHFARRSFCYATPVIWNSLPTEVIMCDSKHSFKRHLKTFLFNSCHQTVWPIPHQRLCSLL